MSTRGKSDNVVCSLCGKYVNKSDVTLILGENYCPECLVETNCPDCQERMISGKDIMDDVSCSECTDNNGLSITQLLLNSLILGMGMFAILYLFGVDIPARLGVFIALGLIPMGILILLDKMG